MSSRKFAAQIFRMAAEAFLEFIGYYDDGLAVEELIADKHTRKSEIVWMKAVVVHTLLSMGWNMSRVAEILDVHHTTIMHYRDTYVPPYGYPDHKKMGQRFAEQAKRARLPVTA